jgi:hypothetical protein
LGETTLTRVVVWGAEHCMSELELLGPEVEFFEGSTLAARGRRADKELLEPTPEKIKKFIK